MNYLVRIGQFTRDFVDGARSLEDGDDDQDDDAANDAVQTYGCQTRIPPTAAHF